MCIFKNNKYCIFCSEMHLFNCGKAILKKALLGSFRSFALGIVWVHSEVRWDLLWNSWRDAWVLFSEAAELCSVSLLSWENMINISSVISGAVGVDLRSGPVLSDSRKSLVSLQSHADSWLWTCKESLAFSVFGSVFKTILETFS